MELLVIGLYLSAVLGVGFWSARKSKSSTEDYILAGRTLTLPVFIATLVATWYGGILGVGEFSYTYGLSNWLVLGLPYYLFAFLYALFFAQRIRAETDLTLPDRLEKIYGRKAALFGGFLVFLITNPAPYVLILGVLLQWVTGWNLPLCVSLSVFFSAVYLYRGGFRADVWTDVFEFFLMFAGIFVILPFAYKRWGGLDFLRAHLPATHLSIPGRLSWGTVLAWYFIALWTFVDPAFYQRCSAARNGETAKKGMLLSIPFWFLFDAMTTTAGLYARAALPDLAEPMKAYPALARMLLPAWARGLFFAGMLATAMSTLNTLTFLSAMSAGKDVLARWRNVPEASQEDWVRKGLLPVSLFSIFLALCLRSVVGLWYAIGACTIPALLFPVWSSYYPSLRIRAGWVLAAMISGWGISTFSLILGRVRFLGASPGYLFGLEPIYLGLMVSGMIWLGGLWRARSA